MDFGKKYGYNFEHEATYEKMCLVNDAVYIAKYKGGKHDGEWTATGAQFAHPYVFKTCFSREEIIFKDLCETKTVNTALYLDMNEGLIDVAPLEAEREKLIKKLHDISRGKLKTKFSDLDIKEMKFRIEELENDIPKGHHYTFVGKAGSFCPIKPGCGGGILLREKDGNFYAAGGTKNFRWLEAEHVAHNHMEDDIDILYFNDLVDKAREAIDMYVDFEWFRSDDPYTGTSDDPIIPF